MHLKPKGSILVYLMFGRLSLEALSRTTLIFVLGTLVFSNFLLNRVDLQSPIVFSTKRQCDDVTKEALANVTMVPAEAGALRMAQSMSSFEALVKERFEKRNNDSEASLFAAVYDFFWGMEGGIVLKFGGHTDSIRSDFLPFHWHEILVSETNPIEFQDATFISKSTICTQNRDFLTEKSGRGFVGGILEFVAPSFVQDFAVEDSEGSIQQKQNANACLSLNKVFSCLRISRINLFVLDAEGGELSLLESFDFDDIQLDVLVVKTEPRPPGFGEEVAGLLQKQDYIKEFDRGPYSWFRYKFYSRRSKQLYQTLREDDGLRGATLTWSRGNKTTLNTLCPPESPRFLSFAWTHGGRWSLQSMLTAAQLMYSSLARAHNCAPVVYVYTDVSAIAEGLRFMKTTLGTKAEFRTEVRSTRSVPSRGYDAWRALSRYKMDVIAEHLRNNDEQLIWLDLDTFVFTDLSEVSSTHSWVVGWGHGKRGVLEEYSSQLHSGVTVPPKFDTMGDLWTLNAAAVAEVLALEEELDRRKAAKPMYDLQGLFSILLTKGSASLKVMQDILPYHSFGFQCSFHEHPTTKTFQPMLLGTELYCPDMENIGLGYKVGSMSFTSPTFEDMVLADPKNFSKIQNADVRAWFEKWFYDL